MPKPNPNDTYHCSFCGKNQHEVANLVKGPQGVFICDECTVLCMNICTEACAFPVQENQLRQDTLAKIQQFSLTSANPKRMNIIIKRYIAENLLTQKRNTLPKTPSEDIISLAQDIASLNQLIKDYNAELEAL